MSVPNRMQQQQGDGPNLVNMETIRNQSELLRTKCLRLISETDKASKRMQTDDKKQLGKEKRKLFIWVQRKE